MFKKQKEKKKKNTKKRVICTMASILIFVASVMGVLQLGCVYAASTWTPFRPDYAKIDITSILNKETLTKQDYETLYRQTGLTKLGIDGYLEKGDLQSIVKTQDAFFFDHEVIVDCFNIFTYDETLNATIPMANLKKGDILVTSTTRVSWWRYGHAAIVIDGEKEVIVESIAPGTKSMVNYANTFSNLANFLILRPTIPQETKDEVAEYAKDNLMGLRYGMTVGVLSKKYPETLKSTQCAHLVWYAYKKFGFDLDSTGGGVVKPQDMALSEYVEVVQAYGFDLDELWS